MGIVYLVGAGPGNPDLITVKGMELLKRCDAVVYDRLGTYQLLEYVPEHCEKIYVGKQAGAHYKKQSEINEILVKAAKKHEIVVRLKGGDPFVFGRGGEEVEVLLAAGIPFKVIPGITSAIAVPETVGIPVTHRGVARSFHVITGHTMEKESLTDIESSSCDQNVSYERAETYGKIPLHIKNLEGTSIFLMGLSNLGCIVENLMKQGKKEETPVAVISNGTLPGEQVVRGTLKTIESSVKKAKLSSPAIIVVGETAGYDFYSPIMGPLTGKHIGMVGTGPLREKLKYKLEQYGGKSYSLCDMKVILTENIKDLQESLLHLMTYTWIGFTSQNAINIFFESLKKWKIDLRKLSHIKFAVVGSGTKQALERQGFTADFMPETYTTESMALELAQVMKKDEKLLLPRAKQGSVRMLQILDEQNVSYDAIPIYDVIGKHTENMEYLKDLDSVLFVSASGVKGFFENDTETEKTIKIIKDHSIKLACLGEVTERALKQYGLEADIVPKVNDVDGLVKAVINEL